MTIKFSEIKSDIEKAIKESIKRSPIPNEQNITLIDGFVSFSVQQEIQPNFIIGGPNIPMVAVVGGSGRIYTYALKALLPNIELP